MKLSAEELNRRVQDRIKWMKTCSLCGSRFSFRNEGTSKGKITGGFTCGPCIERFDEPLEALSGIVTKDVLIFIREDIKRYCNKRSEKNEE